MKMLNLIGEKDKVMKWRIGCVDYLCLLFATVLLTSCGNTNSNETIEYGEATLELIEIVENNPNIKSLLIASIEKAKAINPDRRTNPAQSLEEYYEFVTWAEKSMVWSFLKDARYSTIYDNAIQSIVYFYFLNDQPLPELEGKGYYNNSLQYVDPYRSWLVSFNKSYGKYLDTENSWNEEFYQMALEDDKWGLKKDWYEDRSNWKTFNQFFSRYLKSPDKRPITAPEENSIVVAAADSQPMGVWEIDSNSNISLKEGVAIKSGTLNSIEKLIGEDSEYEKEFANGTFTHAFLDLNDYHRYHFPLSGIVKEVRIISEQNAVGAIVFWDAANNRYAFDPSKIGWQSIETRGCVILETEEHGLVALLPIGMAQIGSVNFEENIKEGLRVAKGDMLGHFLFGGSDFAMIFQEKAGFILDSPTKQDSQSYQHLLVGERVGSLNRK